MGGPHGFYTKKTRGRSGNGLTATQVIILRNAWAGPVRFLAGDRKGTRCVSYDDLGTANIVAYGTPEFFLEGRGLIGRRNERNCFDITDKGRAAVARFIGEGTTTSDDPSTETSDAARGTGAEGGA